MNFLAHTLLAGERPAMRLGGLLGDFVKGPLPAGLPEEVAEGVRLHRAIDRYADTHPAFRASRARVSTLRRRYAGIMVDLFYDHFLAARWTRFHPEPLATFSAAAYGLLAEHQALLPPQLAEILPVMRREDWLTAYREAPAVGRALDRMALRRLSRPNPLGGAGEELLANYEAFAGDFEAFFPDARRFAAAGGRPS